MALNPTAYNNAYLYDCDKNVANQVFHFDVNSHRIQHGGLCLDFDLRNNNVYFHECHTGSNQQWKYFSVSKGIKTQHSDDYCLEWGNGNLYMNICDGRESQQFMVPTQWLPNILAINIVSILADSTAVLSSSFQLKCN